MKPCPKCNGSVPKEKDTCPHCGLVLHKWEASQQHVAAKPVELPIAEEPEGRGKENLSFLVGWFGGVVPTVAIMVAAYNYLEGHKRKAFQALIAAWWAYPIFIARAFTSYQPSGFSGLLMAIMPLITLFLLRKLDWPINTPSDEFEPKDLNAYLHGRRITIGSVIVLLAAIGLVGHLYPIDTNFLFLFMSGPVVIYGGYALVQVVENLTKPTPLVKRLDNLLKLGVSIIFIVMSVSVLTASERVTEAKMKTVIAALDEYHAVYGDYPKSADALIPEYLAKVPPCQFGWLSYWRNEDGSYSLTCHYFVFMKRAYDSGTGRWYSYD